MSISYRDRDFNIELDQLEFLYNDESVKRACRYVDMQRKAIDWTFDGLMDVTRSASRIVEVNDHELKRVVNAVLFYTVDEFLKMEHLAEGSRFHDYLMCDALSYYLYMHSTEVKYKRYQVTTIDITDRIRADRVQACACGHKKPIVVIGSILESTCIRITCPCCGAKVIEVLESGQLIKTGKGMYATECTFSSLETAIKNCIQSWDIQCGKTTEYKALELLISEFFGRMDVSPKVREYSQLLREYVRRNKLDRGMGRNYEGKLADKLYQDTVAMDIVNDYLWENSSNKEGDGIQSLSTWDFDTFSLMGVRGA